MTANLPRWTRQSPDVRRRQLLDAASDVILEKGFDAMTVAEVARRAGVGKGTVYLYFESKTALLTGVQDRYWEEMLEVVAGAIEHGEPSWAERLDRTVEGLVEFGAGHIDLYHALFHETPTTGGEPLEAFIAVVGDVVRGGGDAGEFDVVDPTMTAAFLVSAFHGTGAKTAHLKPAKRQAATELLQTLFRRTVGVS